MANIRIQTSLILLNFVLFQLFLTILIMCISKIRHIWRRLLPWRYVSQVLKIIIKFFYPVLLAKYRCYFIWNFQATNLFLRWQFFSFWTFIRYVILYDLLFWIIQFNFDLIFVILELISVLIIQKYEFFFDFYLGQFLYMKFLLTQRIIERRINMVK